MQKMERVWKNKFFFEEGTNGCLNIIMPCVVQVGHHGCGRCNVQKFCCNYFLGMRGVSLMNC